MALFAQGDDGVAIVGAFPRPAVGAGDKLHIHRLINGVMTVEKAAKARGGVKGGEPIELNVGWVLVVVF